MRKLDNELSRRIAMLRFLMIFGVVIVHTPPYRPVTDYGTSLYSLVLAFFQHGLFRATVPLLTVISGYLLFSSGLYLNWKKLFQKKGATLVIPFLVFNLGMLAIDIAAQTLMGKSLAMDFDRMTMQRWFDAAFGLHAFPYNAPLYFMRDLIVLCALSPLLGRVLDRAPLLGLLIVGTVFLANLDGHLILRADMPVEFYVGGLLAVTGADLGAADRFARAALALLVIACFGILWFGIGEFDSGPGLVPFRMLTPLLVWPAASLLDNTAFGAWLTRMSKYSFFVFIAHYPMMLGLWTVNQHLGTSGADPDLFTIVAPLCVTGVLVSVHRVASRIAPSPFAWITGQRRPTSAAPEVGSGPRLADA